MIKLDTFMNDNYSDIVKKAKKEDAIIFWGDEIGINNQAYYARGFAPNGITIVIAFLVNVTKKQR